MTRLLEQWDASLGVSNEADSVPTSEAQLAEARRRLVEHDADSSSAIPWSEAEQRLRSKK